MPPRLPFFTNTNKWSYQPLLKALDTLDTANTLPPTTFNPTCPACHAEQHTHHHSHHHPRATPETDPTIFLYEYDDDADDTSLYHHPPPNNNTNTTTMLDASQCPICAAHPGRGRATDILLAFMTLLCPPGVAYIKTGPRDLCLNVLLCLFLIVPGMMHAWYLILVHPGVHYRHAGEAIHNSNTLSKPYSSASSTTDGAYLEQGRPHHSHQLTSTAYAPYSAQQQHMQGEAPPQQMMAAAPANIPVGGGSPMSSNGVPVTTTGQVVGHWRDGRDGGNNNNKKSSKGEMPPSYAMSN